MRDMTYRVYIRWPNQKTAEKTTTEDPDVAELAFSKLCEKAEFGASNAIAVFSKDNRGVKHFDFESMQLVVR